MYTLVIVIHIIACFILIATILLQSGRGGGLSGLFGGGTSQTIFGARASTFLTRTTTIAAIAFLLTCISLTVFSSRRAKSLMQDAPETEVTSEVAPESSTPESAPEQAERQAIKEIEEEKESEVNEVWPQEMEEPQD